MYNIFKIKIVLRLCKVLFISTLLTYTVTAQALKNEKGIIELTKLNESKYIITSLPHTVYSIGDSLALLCFYDQAGIYNTETGMLVNSFNPNSINNDSLIQNWISQLKPGSSYFANHAQFSENVFNKQLKNQKKQILKNEIINVKLINNDLFLIVELGAPTFYINELKDTVSVLSKEYVLLRCDKQFKVKYIKLLSTASLEALNINFQGSFNVIDDSIVYFTRTMLVKKDDNLNFNQQYILSFESTKDTLSLLKHVEDYISEEKLNIFFNDNKTFINKMKINMCMSAMPISYFENYFSNGQAIYSLVNMEHCYEFANLIWGDKVVDFSFTNKLNDVYYSTINTKDIEKPIYYNHVNISTHEIEKLKIGAKEYFTYPTLTYPVIYGVKKNPEYYSIYKIN